MQINQKWITDFSFWWGTDGVKIDNFIGNSFFDLAVGKLYPFDSNNVKYYPIIKNPKNLKLGTSLCKLGYPFHTIQAVFNEESSSFTLQQGSLPIPRFPIEGIYTRDCIHIDPIDINKQTKFIETSSPGLRGQSGGAIFDTEGVLWGIQSHTFNLELGFNPQIKKNNKIIEENQFLNVGLGVHPEVLVSFLSENKITFQLSDN